LVESTTLWTPSVRRADEPVIAAATNFDAAIPRFASRAMTSVRVLAVAELIETDFIRTVFPHPTLSEKMHESVLAAFGRVIHI
jgi:hypothetical protein